jgi:predicted nucleic acid-binding protein
MKRCVLIIRDSGPFNNLWVAGQLDLLLTLEMPLVVVDAVYDELTNDMSYPKDKAVKAFIDGNQPPFTIEKTDLGQDQRQKRQRGERLTKNAGELAIVDFISYDDGLRKYLRPGDPVALLFEDAGVRVINKPPNLHLLSTVGMLRGLERVGAIASADEIIHEMTLPLSRTGGHRIRGLLPIFPTASTIRPQSAARGPRLAEVGNPLCLIADRRQAAMSTVNPLRTQSFPDTLCPCGCPIPELDLPNTESRDASRHGR